MTIILLTVATVVQILAAGAIGAERYGLETGKIRKKYSEFAFKLVSFSISGVAFFLLHGFTAAEVFWIPIEVINGFTMMIAATIMLIACSTIITMLNDANDENIVGFFIIIILLIIFIMEVLFLAIESQSWEEMSRLISLVGGIIVYGELLYRITIIGGNLRIIKLELETSD